MYNCNGIDNLCRRKRLLIGYNDLGLDVTKTIAYLKGDSYYYFGYSKLLLLARKMKKKGLLPIYDHRNYFGLFYSRVNKIVEMKREKKTHQEIGKELGVSSSCVGTIVKRIKREYGHAIFDNEEYFTLKQAAEKVGLPCYLVYDLCHQRTIPFARNGRKYFLTKQGMEALAEYAGSRDGSNSRKGKAALWHRVLRDELENWQEPKNEEWISLAMAMEKAGVSKMKVWYLAKLGIVATKPGKTISSRSGRPCSLYSASQMEIVAKVHRDTSGSI